MVSLAGQSGTQRLQAVSKVAAFLGADENDVSALLADGRLEAALLTVLPGRGVSLTPSLKNSVQAMVRSLEARADVPPAAKAMDSQCRSGATATIMFTDIVGSSSMMERLGDRAGRKLLSLHDEIIRHEVTAHEGTEVKSLEDGFMLTFRSVGRGLACAIAIQKDLGLHAARNPEARISVRIGLSVGEPIQHSEDLIGMSVIMAARISAMAQGGQVLLSQVAYALAASSGDFEFEPVGPVELKGIAGRHELYEVLWDEGQGIE